MFVKLLVQQHVGIKMERVIISTFWIIFEYVMVGNLSFFSELVEISFECSKAHSFNFSVFKSLYVRTGDIFLTVTFCFLSLLSCPMVISTRFFDAVLLRTYFEAIFRTHKMTIYKSTCFWSSFWQFKHEYPFSINVFLTIRNYFNAERFVNWIFSQKMKFFLTANFISTFGKSLLFFLIDDFSLRNISFAVLHGWIEF